MTLLQKAGVYLVGGAMLGMAGMITYNAVTKNDSSETEKLGATATQSITISTDNLVPLTFQMSAASVDICYVKATTFANERDLLEPEFLAKMKALGFNRLLKYSDGAIANVNHIVFAPAIGKGYNGLRSDFKSQKEFDEAMGGVLSQTGWQSDFFTKTTDFIRAVGVPDDVVLNPNDTWEQNKYRLSNSSGEYVFLGSEEVTTNTPKTWTPAQYLAWAKPISDSVKKHFPDKKLIADQGQLYTGTRNTLQWRKEITPVTLPGMYGADCYMQLNDVMKFTFNMDSNIMKADVFFDSIIPFHIDSFKRSFPAWKWVVGEVHIVDAREESEPYTPINRNMVGVYCWGRFYQMFITNQDLIPSAVQMELRKYINPDENNTKVITLLNTLLKPGSNVSTLTLSQMPGCNGVSINNIAQSKTHSVLITNNSDATYTLTKVIVNARGRSPEFKMQRMYASTWDGVVTRDSVSSSTITILPKSVSVTTFTTGTTAQVPTVPSKIK